VGCGAETRSVHGLCLAVKLLRDLAVVIGDLEGQLSVESLTMYSIFLNVENAILISISYATNQFHRRLNLSLTCMQFPP